MGLRKQIVSGKRMLLHLRRFTQQYMLCGELGRFLVYITVKLRKMMYWYRLITGKQSILALPMYKLLLKDIHNVYNHKWIISVKYVLDDVGNAYIYGYHNVVRSLVPQCYD